MLDRFCQGLKQKLLLEVMKYGASTFNGVCTITLNAKYALVQRLLCIIRFQELIFSIFMSLLFT